MTLSHVPQSKITKHLKKEAKGIDYLVLWLDCDREGENICYEVIDCTLKWMRPHPGKIPFLLPLLGTHTTLLGKQTIFRAKFSSITGPDIWKAMETLGRPNPDEAAAVDVRQELDLKVGVAFTRFQVWSCPMALLS